MTLQLAIVNKAYSSWSLRPWLLMVHFGIPFEETLIPMGQAETRERILRFSPTGKCPALRDGDIVVWESLAILEYLAEKFPDAHLWPAYPNARAHARAISAEMHSGFLPLRRECPMNFWRPVKQRELSPDAAANVARIDAIWSDCRARFGRGGLFLFGAFSAADAMYAPVVSRFATYAVNVGSVSRTYMDAIMSLDAWQEWKAAALKEPWVLPEDEPDWPLVLKA